MHIDVDVQQLPVTLLSRSSLLGEPFIEKVYKQNILFNYLKKEVRWLLSHDFEISIKLRNSFPPLLNYLFGLLKANLTQLILLKLKTSWKEIVTGLGFLDQRSQFSKPCYSKGTVIVQSFYYNHFTEVKKPKNPFRAHIML